MFNNKIQYLFENGSGNWEAKLSPEEQSDSNSISVWTNDLNTFKDEPVLINYIYSAKTPEVETLKFIQVSVSFKNDQGVFETIPASTSEISMEYFDGKLLVPLTKKNLESPLNSLIDWSAVNYQYEFNGVTYDKKNNAVTFSGKSAFPMKKYPDSLKVSVKLIWENKERTSEALVHKEKYKGPKLNLKY